MGLYLPKRESNEISFHSLATRTNLLPQYRLTHAEGGWSPNCSQDNFPQFWSREGSPRCNTTLSLFFSLSLPFHCFIIFFFHLILFRFKALSFYICICSDRILTCRIKSIRSPAKVGLVVTDLITSPVVSWERWETPPPPSTEAQLSFFAQPPAWKDLSAPVVTC